MIWQKYYYMHSSQPVAIAWTEEMMFMNDHPTILVYFEDSPDYRKDLSNQWVKGAGTGDWQPLPKNWIFV